MEKPLGKDFNIPITSSKIHLLNLFKQNEGKFLTLAEISEKTGIHRSSLSREFQYLRDRNYKIEFRQKAGYRLPSSPGILHILEYLPFLHSRRYGRTCRHFRVVDSTNRIAKLWAQEGAPDGAVIVAEYQSKGYGRFGRKWFSPYGKNILFSLVIYPSLDQSEVLFLPFAAANAICEAVEHTLSVQVDVFWPNDILLEGKKLSGVLVENVFRGRNLEYSIVGAGVNVNSVPEDYPEGLRGTIATLKAVTKEEISRPILFARILENLEKKIAELEEGNIKETLSEWTSRASFLNSQVQAVLLDEQIIAGEALSVDTDGKLRIKTREKIVSLDSNQVIKISRLQ